MTQPCKAGIKCLSIFPVIADTAMKVDVKFQASCVPELYHFKQVKFPIFLKFPCLYTLKTFTYFISLSVFSVPFGQFFLLIPSFHSVLSGCSIGQTVP